MLAEFESRYNLLLDPLLVAVRFYEKAHSPLPHTYTNEVEEVDDFSFRKDRTSIVSTSSPQPQNNIKVCIAIHTHTIIHTYIHCASSTSFISSTYIQIPVNKYVEIIDSNLLSDIHAYIHTYFHTGVGTSFYYLSAVREHHPVGRPTPSEGAHRQHDIQCAVQH